MKLKPLVFLLALSVLSSVAFSQSKISFFQLGIKGGANITKVDGKSFNDEFKFGYHLGGFAQIKITDMFQVQPEVLWNQFNTKTGTGFDTIYNGESFKNVTLNYLSIPLLLNFSPSKFVTIQAGPQFGILLDKNKELLENGKEAFKSGDFSMLGGIQFNLSNFKISGRYVLGLANINDIDNKDKWKNQGFQVSVGFRIV